MDTYTLMRLIFLGLLLAAVVMTIAPSLFRGGNKSLQQVGIWALIFLSVTLAFSAIDGPWKQSRPRASIDNNDIRIERFYDGHYYITANLNGIDTEFVIDTGASSVVLTREAALAAGLNPERLVYSGTAMTANGETRVAPARIKEFAVGDIIDRNIRVLVNEGEMDISLMGMSYLQRFDKIEISNQEMVLSR